jgi:hypothetical protein
MCVDGREVSYAQTFLGGGCMGGSGVEGWLPAAKSTFASPRGLCESKRGIRVPDGKYYHPAEIMKCSLQPKRLRIY